MGYPKMSSLISLPILSHHTLLDKETCAPNAVDHPKHWHTPIQIAPFWYAKPIPFIPQQFWDKLRIRTTLQPPTHNYIISYIPHYTHTYNAHPHKHHSSQKCLLTRMKTSPIGKSNHWCTPTNGTIWTSTTISFSMTSRTIKQIHHTTDTNK